MGGEGGAQRGALRGRGGNARTTLGSPTSRRLSAPKGGEQHKIPPYRKEDTMPYGDLCALADVTAWLQTGQNPFPATDDALLTRLITAASLFIETWLQRQIAVSDWIEVRD